MDKVYTSVLQRAINTSKVALEAAGKPADLPTERSEKLNERHYGDLQGLNKAETAQQYGDEQVKIWRRSYDVPPPGVRASPSRTRRPAPSPTSRPTSGPTSRPARTSWSSPTAILRSIVMELDQLTREQVLELNIPTGVPLVYDFDDAGNITHKAYLFTREDEKKA